MLRLPVNQPVSILHNDVATQPGILSSTFTFEKPVSSLVVRVFHNSGEQEGVGDTYDIGEGFGPFSINDDNVASGVSSGTLSDVETLGLGYFKVTMHLTSDVTTPVTGRYTLTVMGRE
jgi:hypothetical protein